MNNRSLKRLKSAQKVVLIHALGVSADRIFYPKDPRKNSEVEDLIRMLYDCDKRAFAVVKAMVRVMPETTGGSLDTN